MRKIIIIAIALVILGVIGTSIWWYEIRPAIVRSDCNWEAMETLREAADRGISNQDGVAIYGMFYNSCLRKKGLNK